jgi:hypothetical protein
VVLRNEARMGQAAVSKQKLSQVAPDGPNDSEAPVREGVVFYLSPPGP